MWEDNRIGTSQRQRDHGCVGYLFIGDINCHYQNIEEGEGVGKERRILRKLLVSLM